MRDCDSAVRVALGLLPVSRDVAIELRRARALRHLRSGRIADAVAATSEAIEEAEIAPEDGQRAWIELKRAEARTWSAGGGTQYSCREVAPGTPKFVPTYSSLTES